MESGRSRSILEVISLTWPFLTDFNVHTPKCSKSKINVGFIAHFSGSEVKLESWDAEVILEVDFTYLIIFLPFATFNTPKCSESKINVGFIAHFSGSEVKLESWEVEVNIGG